MRPSTNANPEAREDDQPAALTTGKRALVLFNDAARTVADNVRPALDILRGYGFDVTKPPIPTRPSAIQAVRDHKDDVDLVIAAGGDGTLNSVLQGIVGTGLPM